MLLTAICFGKDTLELSKSVDKVFAAFKISRKQIVSFTAYVARNNLHCAILIYEDKRYKYEGTEKSI